MLSTWKQSGEPVADIDCKGQWVRIKDNGSKSRQCYWKGRQSKLDGQLKMELDGTLLMLHKGLWILHIPKLLLKWKKSDLDWQKIDKSSNF